MNFASPLLPRRARRLALSAALGLAALSAGLSGTASGATMSLSFSTLGQDLATNWANGAGEGGKRLVWGIIIDGDGDGLASTYAPSGVNFATPISVGQSLMDASGLLTDDMLFISPFGMPTVPEAFDGMDGATVGLNAISSIESIPFLTGIDPGDIFHLVWFDMDLGASGAAPTGAPQAGDAFGIFSHANFVVPGWGHNTSYATTFDGVDPLKQMTHTWSSQPVSATPEPSSALLGILGAGLLLRRRRA